MRKLIVRGYGIAVILLLFLFFYGLMNLRLSVFREHELTGYGEITEYEDVIVKVAVSEDAPIGEKQVITFQLHNIRSDYDTLLFLTAHQNVDVYLDGELRYRLRGEDKILVPKSPGIVYNEVVFRDEDNGKMVRIELFPVYQRATALPDLMLGNGYQIVKVILVSNLPILGLCACVIFIGIMQIIMALMSGSREENLEIALSHSAFTIIVGIWKILDSDFIALFGKAVPTLSLFSFVILMFMPLMVAKFVRDALDAYKSAVWQVPEVVTMVGVFFSWAFQLFGVADFRESLWITEVCFVISFVCVFIGIGIQVRNNGLGKNEKAGTVCAVLSFFWIVIDLYTYFETSGVTNFPFSMLLFLIFLLLMIGNRIRISRHGMEDGMKARQYKKLAYHDALTGFFNRAAYVDFLSGSEFNPRKSVLVAFDLNNLKKCNDELGHDKGDLYIKESAKIIMDCFGERGRCYRLGGDEFGAILIDDTLEGCAKRAKRMAERVKRFNQASSDIHMGIACGYAVYDPKEDEDVHAAIRRADKMMYEEKFRMKQQAET